MESTQQPIKTPDAIKWRDIKKPNNLLQPHTVRKRFVKI